MTASELRTFMQDHKWNAVQLAARVPCTPAHIWLVLQGKRNLGKTMEMRIRSLPKRTKPVL